MHRPFSIDLFTRYISWAKRKSRRTPTMGPSYATGTWVQKPTACILFHEKKLRYWEIRSKHCCQNPSEWPLFLNKSRNLYPSTQRINRFFFQKKSRSTSYILSVPVSVRSILVYHLHQPTHILADAAAW